MSYDLYVEKPQGNIVPQLRLLVCEDSVTAAGKFVQMLHSRRDRNGNRLPSKYERFIAQEKSLYIDRLGFIPSSPDLSALPPGSWFLQFTFTLAKPWMSKDDDPFYVAESVNPVRKDKVFKVPLMSAASWKGLLRWTAMHTCLELQKDRLSPEEFAQERFVQTLLFGDEKGEEPGETKDFAAHLDALKPEARQEYERLLRAYYELKPDDTLPHHSGRLMFYPTFFDLIDVEVINPHSRQTKAGTHPIYLECVPQGAKGTFSLLYVPFDLIGQGEAEVKQQALADLHLVAEGLCALFLTYGFSAKRTSGYGVAEDKIIKGEIKTRAGRHDLTGKELSRLMQEVGNVSFA
jgi:CRISPR-associated protein Cmr2